jgi:hypothetical protein
LRKPQLIDNRAGFTLSAPRPQHNNATYTHTLCTRFKKKNMQTARVPDLAWRPTRMPHSHFPFDESSEQGKYTGNIGMYGISVTATKGHLCA